MKIVQNLAGTELYPETNMDKEFIKQLSKPGDYEVTYIDFYKVPKGETRVRLTITRNKRKDDERKIIR